MGVRTVYTRVIILAGLITTLLNTQLLHLDEELFIGIVSCIFFYTLYTLTRANVTNMFFHHCNTIYMGLAFVLHMMVITLDICKQLVI